MDIDFNLYDVIIIGAGLSGSVLAERFANIQNKKVLIIDKRDHIGGNCYDYIDDNGILVSKYGAHLFHTNYEDVWEYINRFDKWVNWEHTVIGNINDKLFSIPVNITTVNILCEEHISNSAEMDLWLQQKQLKYDNITNSEEMAKSRIGENLYNLIVKDYTKKQWDKYPSELDSSVLARIPIKNNHDTRYFTDKYQVLPHKGYTHFFEQILNSNKENITVKLNIDYKTIKDKLINLNKVIIFTGPIDQYFENSGLSKLEYRSIKFEFETHENMNYYQPNSVVNYPSSNVDFTRIIEFKHFLNQKSKNTTIVKEYSCAEGDPYYPVPNKKNTDLYNQYKLLADNELKNNVHFIGRLANYKYFNMDQAIKNSLDYFNSNFIIN